jgi:DNA-binding response OmpR family regulator
VVATIVLAEDDSDLRTMYAAFLRNSGYAVLEAEHGRQALDMVRAHRPELLLLDIWMPLLNGFEVLDRLRHDPVAGHTKVMMLSCQSDADVRLESFGSGAVQFLVKGLSLQELLAQVERCVAEASAAPDPL